MPRGLTRTTAARRQIDGPGEAADRTGPGGGRRRSPPPGVPFVDQDDRMARDPAVDVCKLAAIRVQAGMSPRDARLLPASLHFARIPPRGSPRKAGFFSPNPARGEPAAQPRGARSDDQAPRASAAAGGGHAARRCRACGYLPRRPRARPAPPVAPWPSVPLQHHGSAQNAAVRADPVPCDADDVPVAGEARRRAVPGLVAGSAARCGHASRSVVTQGRGPRVSPPNRGRRPRSL